MVGLRLRVVGLICLAVLLTCIGVSPLTAQMSQEVHQELLPGARDQKIEIYWTKPRGDGPFPALLYIHGHQELSRPGGKQYVDRRTLASQSEQGFVAVAMSQPGYGNSSGPPDYTGPKTQDAALRVLTWMRTQPFVQKDRVGLFGYSRGAIVGGMVAAQDPALAVAVLAAGAYDLAAYHRYQQGSGIAKNIEREAGTTPRAFEARSALFHADRINAAVLLLHGGSDTNIPVSQAEAFHRRLQEAGKKVTLKVFPGARHSIPSRDLDAVVSRFLRENLSVSGPDQPR